MFFEDILVDYNLSEDIPDVKLVFIVSKGLGLFKATETFVFEDADENHCRVKYLVEFRMVEDGRMRVHVIDLVGCLLMLEHGYEAKNEKHTR